jgi:hypothetical protein
MYVGRHPHPFHTFLGTTTACSLCGAWCAPAVSLPAGRSGAGILPAPVPPAVPLHSLWMIK